jgi:hypothetical protein
MKTYVFEHGLDVMTPGVERDDRLSVEPRRLGREVERRKGVGVIGTEIWIQGVESDGEGFVYAIRARVSTDEDEEVGFRSASIVLRTREASNRTDARLTRWRSGP